MRSSALLSMALFATIATTGFSHVEDFPKENYKYGKKDKGFAQYAAKDLVRDKKIVLTFDDGPSIENTPRLLDILKKYGVQATFFINTHKVDAASQAIVDRALKEGHFVASHDHTHENNNNTNEAAFRADLKTSFEVIEAAEKRTGVNQKEVYFRFPYGAYGETKKYHHMNVMRDVSYDLYDENCINFVFWDIDTNDWIEEMSSSQLVDNVMAAAIGGKMWARDTKKKGFFKKKTTYSLDRAYTAGIGGGIVLMHDIHAKTVDAVEGIILGLKKNNIEIVPLNQSENFNFDKKNCEYRK